MSLEHRKDMEKVSNDGTEQRKRWADKYTERYEKQTIENLVRQASYKDSLGMELLPEERFVLENKRWLLRKSNQSKKQEEK